MRSLRRSTPFTAAVLAATFGFSLGCSTSVHGRPGDDDDDDDDPDARIVNPGDPDARIVNPGDPDARIVKPGAPDAAIVNPGDPDARVVEPGDPDAGVTNPGGGLGPWTGNDHVSPSQHPPFGLRPNQVPQFVSISFDDNAYSGLEGSAGTGGMDWAVKLFDDRTNPDGSKVRGTFFMTSTYIGSWMSESPTYVKRSWHKALTSDHEIGNHTHSHSHGAGFDAGQWRTEIQTCINWLTKPFDPAEVSHTPDDSKGIGQPRGEHYGYRTPFLEYNDAGLGVVDELGFHYDASIEEGWEYDDTNPDDEAEPTLHDSGKWFYWPYTLDERSPGHTAQVEWGKGRVEISPRPGLWELPVYTVIVPPDDRCAQYGVPSGLRAALKQRVSWFDVNSGKITGFDYNLWVSFKMNKAEFLATLKYTLDQRLAGNRAPFLFGAHTDYYSTKYTAPPNASTAERQDAMEEFLDYARTKPDVRMVSHKQVLDYVRNPTPLR